MAIPRRQIVDTAVTRWYHCVSRCGRGGDLLKTHMPWFEGRLEALAGV